MRPWLVFAAATTFAALAACASREQRPASADFADGPAGADVPVCFFFTGDTSGVLWTCGCESGQYGGLARRATYVKRTMRPGDLAIDLGNLVAGEGPMQQAILAYSLESLTTLGYDAIVPGEREVRMSGAFEDAVRARTSLRVLCANLKRASDGQPVFEPWLLHKLEDGRTLAVVGVVEWFEDPPAAYKVTSAEEAVREAIEALRGKADAVVVAGSLRQQATISIAAQFPELTLVVGGWATEGSKGVRTTTGAPAMLVGEYAWYVSRVELDNALKVRDARQAWLDKDVPDDPDAAALVARYKAEISQEAGDFSARLVASLREQKYLGSASCAECHPAEAAAWAQSGHSHAMQTLATKKSERDPTCIVCHLVDVPELVVDETKPAKPVEALGIGCEACHGGGARHVEFAREGAKADAVRALAPAGAAACLRCHVPPNAMHFDFEHDWPKIAHGPGAGTGASK
jgi:nitrate/TMAO reductase-like tetraheme cytochrome c subunit